MFFSLPEPFPLPHPRILVLNPSVLERVFIFIQPINVDFIQLQTLMYGGEIMQTLAINLLTSISLCCWGRHSPHTSDNDEHWRHTELLIVYLTVYILGFLFSAFHGEQYREEPNVLMEGKNNECENERGEVVIPNEQFRDNECRRCWR